MNTQRAVLVLLAAFSLAASPPLWADSGFAGEWKGVSDGETAFAMHLVDEEGGLSGTIDIPSQSVEGLRLELNAAGDELTGSFTFPDGTKTTFTGKRAEDGGVSGTYKQDYNSGTFTMSRAQKAGAE